MKIKDPELAAQLAIITVVGLAAGAASFTHVHDWTMANSPAGTPGWFGWANAVISELVPIGSLLTIRRNRRLGKPIGMPVFMLLAAACLSLAAQLAVAKPSASGWLLSAVPALAFMGLMKMVLAGLPTAQAVPIADEPELPIHKAADAEIIPIADPLPMPAESASMPVIPAQQPLPIADSEPVADAQPAESARASRPRRQRKHVVPAHPESAKVDVAEIVKRADELKPLLGTWKNVADELGIGTRTLQNYRNAARAATA